MKKFNDETDESEREFEDEESKMNSFFLLDLFYSSLFHLVLLHLPAYHVPCTVSRCFAHAKTKQDVDMILLEANEHSSVVDFPVEVN